MCSGSEVGAINRETGCRPNLHMGMNHWQYNQGDAETPSLGRGLLRQKSTVRVEVYFDGIYVRDQGHPSSLWDPSVLLCPKYAMHG